MGVLTAVALLASVVLHGGTIAAALLDLIVAIVVAGAISNSYAVFWPATLASITLLPLASFRARRSATRALGPRLSEVYAELAALERSVDGASARQSSEVRSSIALIRAWFDGRPPRIDPSVTATIDDLVRGRLGTRPSVVYAGVNASDDVYALRWRSPHERRTQLFGLLVLQLAGEAERHGTDIFVINLYRAGETLIVEARNQRRSMSESIPRGGTASVRALATALDRDNIVEPGPDPLSPDTWVVRFGVPITIMAG